MARLSKEEFVQRWFIRNIKTNDLTEVETGLLTAEILFEAIELRFKKEKPLAKVSKELTGDNLIWFNSIWEAWNDGITKGDKGGKAEAIEAFLSSKIKIDTRKLAVMAYKAALHHAKKTRKDLEAKNSTPPHFNKWFNSGRWDTRTAEVQLDGESIEKTNPEVDAVKAKIADIQGTIDHFKGMMSTVKLKNKSKDNRNDVLINSEKRKTELEAELKQLEG